MISDEKRPNHTGPMQTSHRTGEVSANGQESALQQRIQLASRRHEMCTPLNAIIGYSEMLLEDAEAIQQEHCSHLLENIRSSAKTILSTIDQMVTASTSDGYQTSSDREALENRLVHAIGDPMHDIVEKTESLIHVAHDLDLREFVPDLEKIRKSADLFLNFIPKISVRSSIEEGGSGGDPEGSTTSEMIKGLFHSICPVAEEDVCALAVERSRVLIVDDNGMNRDLLSRHLEKQGHHVTTAENGRQALKMMQGRPFDAILLDILMPEMNGYQVLHQLKKDEKWKDIPVIMISAIEEMDIVAHCIEMGADDYLIKPFSRVLLFARLKSCLERKRLHDLEKEQKRILKETFGKYVDHEVRDAVLSGRIPLCGELKDVTVLFADLRNFTPLTESTPPEKVVGILNSYFTEMTPAISNHRGSVLRYVGDEIFAVFGAPLALTQHFRHAVEAALEMRQRLNLLNEKIRHQGFDALRHGIGIHSGPAVAANIGSPDRLAYDLVGDTVNIASRIQELTKEFDTDILISATTQKGLDGSFSLQALQPTLVKGITVPVEVFRVL